MKGGVGVREGVGGRIRVRTVVRVSGVRVRKAVRVAGLA